MTREEALEKIKELEGFIKELDEKVGFEDDKLFLLSVDEYNKYKDDIPYIRTEWWLRGNDKECAIYVNGKGEVWSMGRSGLSCTIGVRPAIKYNPLAILAKGDCIQYHGLPFKVIDNKNHIAIACIPIAFGPYAGTNTEYKTSAVREYILLWKGYSYLKEEKEA